MLFLLFQNHVNAKCGIQEACGREIYEDNRALAKSMEVIESPLAVVDPRAHIYDPILGFDGALFDDGSLNQSYLKNLDGSFYGRSNLNPFLPESSPSFVLGNGCNIEDAANNTLCKHANNLTQSEINNISVKNNSDTYSSSKINSIIPMSSNMLKCEKNMKSNSYFYDNMTADSNFKEYVNVFSNSKTFSLRPSKSGIYNIIFVTLTKGYHPQLKISEINYGGGEPYIYLPGEDMGNGLYSTRYRLKKKTEYVIEVGTEKDLDFNPFKNFEKGEFRLVISSEYGSLQDFLGSGNTVVKYQNSFVTIPTENEKSIDHLVDSSMTQNKIEMGGGRLNFGITPLLNLHNNSITIFFNNENKFSKATLSDLKDAAEAEFICEASKTADNLIDAKVNQFKSFEFKIFSKTVCELLCILR